MEYVQCKTCSVSVLKQLYRKHALDHGISCCKGCEKQFSYDKRLIAHIEKSDKCGEFYRSNQLEIPTMKQDSRKKKKENGEKRKVISECEGTKEDQEKAAGMYLCPSCGEDLLKPNINLDEHKSGLCMKSSLGQLMEGSTDDFNHQSEDEVGNRFSKPPMNDTLSEDIPYDEDDPMSEESQMENSANEEPDQKKPRLSESYEKENLFESNSSSERLEDEPEVTLDEGNSVKTDPKDVKKKYSLELRISTIKRIEEEGLINIKAIAADIEVKLGVVHKWWLRKDKLKLLHDLKLEKERLTLEKGLPPNPPNPVHSEESKAVPNKTKEITPEEPATTNNSENLLNELQQGLNETGKFLNDLESNSNSYDNNFQKFQLERNEYVQSPVVNHPYTNFSFGNPEPNLKIFENMLPLRKLKPCQQCEGCKTQECTTCKNCLDKPKFGGKNVIRQKCVLKVCDKLQEEKKRREMERKMNLKKTPKKAGPKRQYIKKSDFGSSSMDGVFVKEEVKEGNEEDVNREEDWKYEQIQGSYPVHAQYDGRGEEREGHPSGTGNEQGMAENVDGTGNVHANGGRLENVEIPDSNATMSKENVEGNRTENYIRDVDGDSEFSEHVDEEKPVDSGEGVAEDDGYGEEENASSGKEEDMNIGGMKASSSEELASTPYGYPGSPFIEEGNQYDRNAENSTEYDQRRKSSDEFERNPYSYPGNPYGEHGNPYGEQNGYPQSGYNEEDKSNPSQVYQPNSFAFGNYYGSGSQQSMNINETLKVTKRKRVPGRCKACPPCLDKDCENCKHCLDMVKFGGPGKMRKSCINRKCVGQSRKSSEALPIKSYSPELKVDKPEESRFLLSSFMSDRFPKASNVDVESTFEKVDPPAIDPRKEGESTSLGKLMNFVRNHEVAVKENDQHKSLEESEKDRTELENALGSIRAEASNDWLNNGDLFSMGAVTAEENLSKTSVIVEETSQRRQETEEKGRSENVGNIIRFPGGLEIVPSRKTSDEVFFANEVTITKKVRQTESPQETSFQPNSFPQEPNVPSTQQLAGEQQFSVASKQHPSISQSGVSITKLAQGESQPKKRSQKSKEFNINKILSKLQPVPIAGQPANSQLNITSKDLEPEAESRTHKEMPQMNPQGYNSAKVYHLGDSEFSEDPNQGYYNQFPDTGYYPQNPASQTTQYSNQSYPPSSYPNYSSSYLPSQANYYSSSQSFVPGMDVTQEVTSRGNIQNVQEKPMGQSLGLEDYINNEEARSIQDLLLNDSLNKINSQGISPSIKVEVDEENSLNSTNPKVISFQKSISESFPSVNSASSSTPVTVPQSNPAFTVPKLPTLETQSKLANLTSLNVQVKSSHPYPVASKNLKMHQEVSKPATVVPKSKVVANNESVKDLKSSGNQNIVTLFPTDMEESNDGHGVVNLTKTYTISKQQIDNFRTISRAVVKNEMSAQEAGKLSGLDEEIVKTWVDSLEDILATNQEAVEKARKYEEMKKHVGSLAAKLADLQSMVQLTAVVKKERDAVTELPTFTPLAENIPIDLSVKIPQEEQLPFTNVTDMINKMFC